jgi:hypothetical protein
MGESVPDIGALPFRGSGNTLRMQVSDAIQGISTCSRFTSFNEVSMRLR